ncbi:MAG: RNA polymerase sigma factor [Treponema sp.]|nr:RNA polymerase sigma factor [Treponema sp.]
MGIDVRTCYEKYFPMVFRRCRQMLGSEDDALDAVQDVFVKLLRAEKNLHGRFLSSLLYTVATNICLNRIRGKKRRRELGVEDFEALSLFQHDAGYGEVEARLMIDSILKNESELTRTICFMYHADGMTLKEIGEAVGMSISGVRKRLTGFRARARIQLDGSDVV